MIHTFAKASYFELGQIGYGAVRFWQVDKHYTNANQQSELNNIAPRVLSIIALFVIRFTKVCVCVCVGKGIASAADELRCEEADLMKITTTLMLMMMMMMMMMVMMMIMFFLAPRLDGACYYVLH